MADRQVRVLHLSHTDLRVDQRIRRAMRSLPAETYRVSGLGISIGNQHIEQPGESATPRMVLVGRSFFSAKARVGETSGPLFMQPAVKLPAKNKVLLGFRFLLSVFGQTIKERPEIIHAHDPIALGFSLLVARFSGAKIIYDSHELASRTAGISRFASGVVVNLERFAMKRIHAFITVSEPINDWYRENVGDIPSAVILNTPDWISKKTVERSKEKSGPTFAYVGAFEENRGLRTLLSIFQRESMVGSTLRIVGNGSMTDELVNYASQSPNIVVVEPMAHDALQGYLSDIDYGICLLDSSSLSDYLSLPNKFFEYIFAGVTPICSDFPAMRAMIEDLGVGEVLPQDRDQIMTVFERLAATNSRRRVDIRKLRMVSWEVQAEKMQSLYTSVLNRRNPNP